ncbi:MAG: sigma 54-interacting transcriptional regulator [Deltaproteobacteria bacterium]|nr:sigma 54-interacting transcriptional regulator [Deltaproteobacteria bacterium]
MQDDDRTTGETPLETSGSTRIGGTQIRDDGTGPSLVAHRQKLLVVDGPDRGVEIELSGTHLGIGTAGGNDLVLNDPTVSRRHCEIIVRGERYLVRDLGSTNGTTIDGTPIVEAFLQPNARLRLGDTEILFQPKKKWVRVEAAEGDHFGELYGVSGAMRSVFGLLQKVSTTELSVILIGETGTGKELAARAIHGASRRAQKPFVVVDCGAISENLIESELFGHERGAFTGADRARTGAFELAHSGTIFLDELGELPLELQPKLLRALEQREVKRLGAPRPVEVDVRVIAATNRNLSEESAAGNFREDLFYRLAEVVIELPPLRNRREDIPVITKRLVDEATRSGQTTVRGIADEAMQMLISRDWPGNVRELRNVLRRATALATADVLRAHDLASIEPAIVRDPQAGAATATSIDVGETLAIKDARDRWIAPMEREYLVRILRRTSGNLDAAAAAAGLHRKSLERLLRQHGLRAADVLR